MRRPHKKAKWPFRPIETFTPIRLLKRSFLVSVRILLTTLGPVWPERQCLCDTLSIAGLNLALQETPESSSL